MNTPNPTDRWFVHLAHLPQEEMWVAIVADEAGKQHGRFQCANPATAEQIAHRFIDEAWAAHEATLPHRKVVFPPAAYNIMTLDEQMAKLNDELAELAQREDES